jgi:hypothetical protein
MLGDVGGIRRKQRIYFIKLMMVGLIFTWGQYSY